MICGPFVTRQWIFLSSSYETKCGYARVISRWLIDTLKLLELSITDLWLNCLPTFSTSFGLVAQSVSVNIRRSLFDITQAKGLDWLLSHV